MLKYIPLLFALLVFTGESSACVLKGHERYIKTGKLGELAEGDIIKFSDCSQDIQKKFVRILSGSSGKVLGPHLQEILKSRDTVEIHPEKIEILELEEVLKEKISIEKKTGCSKTHILWAKDSFIPMSWATSWDWCAIIAKNQARKCWKFVLSMNPVEK